MKRRPGKRAVARAAPGPSGRPGPSSARRGAGGRRPKRTPEGKEGVQAVQKKQRQQRAQSSEAETTSPSSKVVKVTAGQRAKWQPLPKNTREQLESMMHWLIISHLNETTQNNSETEKHLNCLRKRLVKRFETLKVPVEKQSGLKNVHKMLAEEKKNSVSLEEGLAKLQEKINKVSSTTELHDGNIQCLQNKIRKLKCQLAAEKATANELFQTNGSDDLGLPVVAQHQLTAPILQDELLTVGNQEGLLNDINTIQESEETKTLFAFLEQAYGYVDVCRKRLSTLVQQRVYSLKKTDLALRGLIPVEDIINAKFLPFDNDQNRAVVTLRDWPTAKQIIASKDKLQRTGLQVTRLFEDSGEPLSLMETCTGAGEKIKPAKSTLADNCKPPQSEAEKVPQIEKSQNTILPPNEPEKDIINEYEQLFIASLEQIKKSPLEFNFATHTSKPLTSEEWTRCRFLAPEEMGPPAPLTIPQKITHQVDIAAITARNGSIFLDQLGFLDAIQEED